MFEIGRLTRLNLGRVGENKARPIEIDVTEWLTDWPGAAIGMLLRRPGEDTYYVASAFVRDGVMHYTPTRADVEIPGEGMAQIVLTGAGDVELRSKVVETRVEESMPGSDSPAPEEPMQPFVGMVIEAAKRAEDAAERAESAGCDTRVYVGDGEPPEDAEVWFNPEGTVTGDDLPTASATVKGGVRVGEGLQMDGDVLNVVPSGGGGGTPGQDGFSPIARVQETATGAVITITDKEGTTTAEVHNGKDGDTSVYVGDGEPPEDAEVWFNPEGTVTGDDLPTASATVKGGVRVGEGLQMDGDVLGVVPDAEWELIESLTFAEDVEKIERTQRPNGSAYVFSGFIVILKVAAGQKSGTYYLRAYEYDNDNSERLVSLSASCGEVPSNWPPSFKHSIAFSVRPYAGLYDAWAASGNQGMPMNMYKATNAEGLATSAERKIRKLMLHFLDDGSNTAPIVKNSTIEIWGVRA